MPYYPVFTTINSSCISAGVLRAAAVHSSNLICARIIHARLQTVTQASNLLANVGGVSRLHEIRVRCDDPQDNTSSIAHVCICVCTCARKKVPRYTVWLRIRVSHDEKRNPKAPFSHRDQLREKKQRSQNPVEAMFPPSSQLVGRRGICAREFLPTLCARARVCVCVCILHASSTCSLHFKRCGRCNSFPLSARMQIPVYACYTE